VTQNTTYYIAVDGKNGSSGAIALGWSLQPSPLNDLFARAQVLGGASGAVNGTNLAAQLEEGEVRHDRVGAGRSVWYRWVAPSTGRATFLSYSSIFRPALAAYDGPSLLGLANVSTRLATDARSMSIGFDATRGQTYGSQVDSYNEGALTKSGGFSLRWTLNTASTRTASLFAPRRVADRRLATWLP
jgi:hypothetical protein